MGDDARSMIQAMFADGEGTPLKMQESKPKVSLVPREGIEGLARVYEYGLIKYERDSWRKFTLKQAEDCLPDAAIRHMIADCAGEHIDPESGLPHLLQVAWNAITLHIIREREKGLANA